MLKIQEINESNINNDCELLSSNSISPPNSYESPNEAYSNTKLDKRIKKYTTLKRKSFKDRVTLVLSVTNTSPSSTSTKSTEAPLLNEQPEAKPKEKNVCLIEESPFYIHKVI